MTAVPVATLPHPSVQEGKGQRVDTWVIVPAYNEAEVIRAVLEGLSEHFSNIVAVDDGSTDLTRHEIRAAGVRLVRHPHNLGMGAAIQTGLDFALLDRRAQFFVTFDADGQHRALDAASMVDRLRAGGADILLGSRFIGGVQGMPRGRRALLRGAKLFERTTSGLRLTDAHNGLRAFSRAFAAMLCLTHADMAHASELLEQVATSGLRYAEHPVTIAYTEYSRRKGQRSINSVNIAVDVVLRQLLHGA